MSLLFFSCATASLFFFYARGRRGQRERHSHGYIVASFAHLLTLGPFLRTVCFSLYFIGGVLSTYVSRHEFLRSQVVPVGWMDSLLIDSSRMVSTRVFPPFLFDRFGMVGEMDGIDWQGSVVRWAGKDEGSPSSCADVGWQPSPPHDGTMSEPPHQRETFECERFQQSKA